MKIISKQVLVIAGVCMGALYYMQAPIPKNAGLALFESGEIERAFVEHLAKYGRMMTEKKDVQKRFEIFRKNYVTIKAHNEKPGVTFKMGINEFADVEFVENRFDLTTGLEGVKMIQDSSALKSSMSLEQ